MLVFHHEAGAPCYTENNVCFRQITTFRCSCPLSGGTNHTLSKNGFRYYGVFRYIYNIIGVISHNAPKTDLDRIYVSSGIIELSSGVILSPKFSLSPPCDANSIVLKHIGNNRSRYYLIRALNVYLGIITLSRH